MIEGAPARSFGTSALISLVPRQVMLEKFAASEMKRNMGRKKGGGSSIGAVGSGRKGLLLSSIAAFLESNGFWRTLAAFRSEAQSEIEGCKETPLDLEDIICRFLESGNDNVKMKVNHLLKNDSQKNGFSKKENGESIHDASEEPIHKQKKKRADGADDNAKLKHEIPLNKVVDESQMVEVQETSKDAAENLLHESHVKSKDKKKKKAKLSSDENVEQDGNEKLQELVEGKTKDLVSVTEKNSSQLDESNLKSKDKKKKKNKLVSDLPVGGVDQAELETFQEVIKEKSEDSKCLNGNSETDSQLLDFAIKHASGENPLVERNSKSKEKKKRKLKSTPEILQAEKTEQLDEGKFLDGKKENLVNYEIKVELNKFDSKNESVSTSENTADVDKKAKKRKRSASEERERQIDNEVAAQEQEKGKPESLKERKETEQVLDESLPSNGHHDLGKKRKTEKTQGGSNKSSKVSDKKQLRDLTDNKVETPKDSEGEKETEGHEQINGKLEKNEREGSTSSKRNKSEHKNSAEPKTVNAFKRVKVEEVKFVDERLQDNSYWAKDGAEIGYGANAQEVLGQVRGRDFRHEKTKKKRGSYRGGQIDLQSHSIKFNYSDEDE